MSIWEHGEKVGGYKIGTTDPAQIRRWWTAHPDANIAMPTGFCSGFLSLDMDSGRAWLFVCEQGFDATAPRVTGTAGNHKGATSRGHFYFKCDGPMKSYTQMAGIEDLELLADGKYVMLPPSVHPNGRQYAWQGRSIFERPAPAPREWLIEAAKSRGQFSKVTEEGREHPPETNTRTKTSTSIKPPNSDNRLGNLPAKISRILRAENTARRLVEYCGQSWPGLGEIFCCILTAEKHPSAAIWAASGSGDLPYKDFHGKCLDAKGRPFDCVPIASVWAAIWTGIIRQLKGAEPCAWALRMLLDLGLYPTPNYPEGLRRDLPAN